MSRILDLDLLRVGDLVARLTPFADVRAYGAVGDGVHDDAPAIQAAIDAASTAGGGIVWLPPTASAYLVSTAIAVPSNIVIAGAGWNLSEVQATGNISVFTLASGVSNVQFRDIRIDGDTTTGAGIYGTGNNGAIQLDRVYIENCDRGLDLDTDGNGAGHNTIVQASHFMANATYGIRVGTDSYIAGCYIGNNGSDTWNGCGAFIDGWGIRWHSNHVWGSNRYGIYLNYTEANGLLGGVIEESQQHSIYCVGRLNDTRIQGVMFTDNGKKTTNTYDHIYIGAPAVGETCNDNIITGCKFEKRAATATNARYCVNEVLSGGVSGDYNLLHGNNFRGAFGTANYAINGVNTVAADNIG